MHQKHTKLSRPAYGQFHRQEWAIIGTPCGEIQKLAAVLISSLSERFRIGYVDADHKSEDLSGRYLDIGGELEYTDKIDFHRFDLKAKLDSYQFRHYFNDVDAVLVNGNHFKAKKQIAVIDPRKEDSLQRKLDRLTNVELILMGEGQTEIYPFLKDHLNGKEVPVLPVQAVNEISNWLMAEIQKGIPPLYGLLLVGGKSTRMGEDKGGIVYHEKPQREHALDLLHSFCEQVFLSGRSDQKEELAALGSVIDDKYLDLGPYGGILSAFREYPDVAWLVIAVDLPLLDEGALKQLVNARNDSKVATAFQSPDNPFPEPLIAIWEPRSYPYLLQFLGQGYSCPRKVLINTDVELVGAQRPEVLMNVNTPEERGRLGKGK